MKMKVKNPIAIAIWAALSLSFAVLICIHSELTQKTLDEFSFPCKDSGFSESLASPLTHHIVKYRLAGVYRLDPVLPSSVVMMSTTPESSLMSHSDLVLPTNNEKSVHKNYKNKSVSSMMKYEYKSASMMIKNAVIVFLQPQIDLRGRVRLCKLRCIQNQYLSQDFSVLISKLQLHTYGMI
jgi:hypothetical protein